MNDHENKIQNTDEGISSQSVPTPEQESAEQPSEASVSPAKEITSAEMIQEETPDEVSSEESPAENPATGASQKPDHPNTIDASILPPIDMGPIATEETGESPHIPVEKPRKWRKTWQHHRLFIILTSVFLLLAIAIASGVSYVYFVIHPYESYDKIFPNVYCAGINLGGMTPEEAQNAVEEALRYPAYSVKVILPDCEYVFQPEQVGITLNGVSIAEKAYAYGRSDPSAYGMYKAYRAAEKTEYRLTAETTLEYSTEDIQNLAVQIYQETEVKPTASTTTCDDSTHTVTLTLGAPGSRIAPQTIYDAVCAAFDSMNFSDIELDYEKVEIDMTGLRTLCTESESKFYVNPVDPVITANEETHAIDLTMGTLGWSLDGTALYNLASEAVEAEDYGQVSLEMTSIDPVDVDITAAYSELACEPTEPYYYAGTVYESQYGYTLDWEAAINQILDSTYGEQLSIPMTPIEPKLTAEEVRAVLFRDELSSYSTPHTSNSNRTNNLSLACEAINGTVINAGETFSFNDVVGERTAAKGYRSATVYVGSESKEELGGGICQVSSTIYNAALYAEMDITSRACHTFFVTYVPGGLDATVYWGSLDFCFRNNTDYPIRINAWVSGGYVHISIDGTKTNDHVVKLSSTCLSTEPYSTVYERDSSLPAGYEKETTYPYTGYTYEAYQYIYDGNGNLLETNYLGKSKYDKRDRVITIGTG